MAIVCEISKAFYILVHSINHIKGFCTKVEWYCATLPIYRETSIVLLLLYRIMFASDMGSLTLLVGLGHMTDSSMVIGQAVVPNIKQLTPNSPLKG